MGGGSMKAKRKKSSKLRELFLKKESSFQNRDDNLNIENTDRLLNYYSSLALFHPDIVIVFSLEGEIISIDNEKIKTIIGRSIQNTEQLIQFIPQKYYKELESIFSNTIKGNSDKYEIEIKSINNQTLFLVLTFIPIKYEGEVEGVYVIITNTTEKVLLKQRLISNEKHLNSAQKIAEIGSWEYLIGENKLFCSDNFYYIFGLDKEEYISMDVPFQLVHPDDYEYAFEKVREAMLQGKSFTNEFRIIHGKHKGTRYIKVDAEVFFEEGKPKKIIGLIKDETYQIKLENQLAEQNESYQYIFNNLLSGIWIRETIEGKFIFASRGLEDILDIPVSKLYEEPNIWYSMIDPNYHQELEVCKGKLRNGEVIKTIYSIKNNNKKTKWILEQVVPRINDDGQVTNVFGLVTDITNEMDIKEKYTYLSNFDSLTGLPNQKSLFEKIDMMCKKDAPFSILYLNIDRLNIINDSLGYSVGDEALRLIAERLKRLSPKDCFLARLSSNDFIMIIKDYIRKDDVYNLAEKIIQNINEPIIIQEYELYVATSIGITFYPEEGKDKKKLLENAHSALYQAKREGKNNYQLSSHLTDISSYKKYVLDRDMRKAIENGEFELYFQPQVDHRNGKICGAEALIRWNHREWGMVSPGEFIPLAEENHMINNITDWVIQRVLSYIRDWIDRGYNVQPISINIPPIRFIKKGLMTFVEQQLKLHKIPAHYILFEITEGSLLKNDTKVIETIEGLKKIGIKFAIDDFGTGYASLDSLRKIKPDAIKIDQIFIKHIGDESSIEKGIISSAIYLSKVLDMKVVAEGVEEIEQLKFLKQIECDLIQGYIYSKPVRAEIFENYLEHGYLRATKTSKKSISIERRNFYRFVFPFPIPAKMTIVEVNGKKVNVGKSPILIKNIGIGGVKVVSSLKLPVNTPLKFSLQFQILNELFEIIGYVKWVEEEMLGIFSYGINFEYNRVQESRLASIVNKLSSYSKNNTNMPGTEFINEDPLSYFNNHIVDG